MYFDDMTPYMKRRHQKILKDRQFELWWNVNKDRIEKRNKHSFSGMIRLSQSPNYYRFYWDHFIFDLSVIYYDIPYPVVARL